MKLIPGQPYKSLTRRVSAPEGEVWVTVCLGPDYAFVGASAGKAGTTAQAAAHAIGVLAGLAIRSGADPAEVALKLRGVTHDRSGPQEATSIADAIGIALWGGLT